MPPKGPSRKGCLPQAIAPFAGVIDAWLRTDITLQASVIHERLAAEHGFPNSYQRVKVYVAGARPRIAAEMDAGDENLAGTPPPPRPDPGDGTGIPAGQGKLLLGDALTVAVIDADTFDDIFRDMVEINEEGTLTKDGRTLENFLFDDATIKRLLATEAIVPSGAACLTVACKHRAEILG